VSDATSKIFHPHSPTCDYATVKAIAQEILKRDLDSPDPREADEAFLWYACAPNATLILVCVYELMRAKRQANISVPPTRPGGRRVAGVSTFKTPCCSKLKSVREGFSTG
jgi:hypothetical protein